MAPTSRSDKPRRYVRRTQAALIAAVVLLTPTATNSGAWFTDTTAPASATLTAATLPAVERLAATQSGKGVRLSWQLPKTAPEADVYTVSRSIGGAPATPIGSGVANGNDFQYQDTIFPEQDARFAQIEASRTGSFTVARDTAGRVWVTGEGGPVFGDGTETVTKRTAFRAVPGPTPNTPAFDGRKIVDIAAGGSSVIAVDDAGEVWTWGHEATPLRPRDDLRPVKSSPYLFGDNRIKDVEAGDNSWVALTQSGRLFTWGANKAHQLGRDTSGALSSTPAVVTSPDAAFASVVFTSVSSGGLHSAALASDGSVWAWGRNLKGELGDGKLNSAPAAVKMQLPSGVDAAQVEAGENITYVLQANGNLWYVGAPPGFGRTSGFERAEGRYLHVSAGAQHGVAVPQGGLAVTWGLGGSAPGLSNTSKPGVTNYLNMSLDGNSKVEAGSETTFLYSEGTGSAINFGRQPDSGGHITNVIERLTCQNNPSCGLSGDIEYSVTYRVKEWTSPPATVSITIRR